MTPRVAIVEAKRTPIGKFLGAFRNVSATELGSAIVTAVLGRAGVAPEQVDEVVFGNARQAGVGPNPARQIAWGAGIPKDKPAFTINMACASSMQAVALAADAIRTGRARCVVAGGTENMTRVPYMMDRVRLGYRLGHAKLVDLMYKDGFGDPLSGMLMGETAEVLAREYGISRAAQDEFAVESQRRTEAANAESMFDEEIVAVTARDDRRREFEVLHDEHPRAGATLDGLGKLPPVFSKDGTVTAGNACGITDGAAALVLMAEEAAGEAGVTPLAFVTDTVVVGVDPERMGIAPVPATRQILERNQLQLEDIPAIELNEAFAVQVLACQKDLGLNLERVNVNGGAIALGHPIGATGARILVTLLHEMRRRRHERGIATLCVSGGLGMSVLLEAATVANQERR